MRSLGPRYNYAWRLLLLDALRLLFFHHLEWICLCVFFDPRRHLGFVLLSQPAFTAVAHLCLPLKKRTSRSQYTRTQITCQVLFKNYAQASSLGYLDPYSIVKITLLPFFTSPPFQSWMALSKSSYLYSKFSPN